MGARPTWLMRRVGCVEAAESLRRLADDRVLSWPEGRVLRSRELAVESLAHLRRGRLDLCLGLAVRAVRLRSSFPAARPVL